jgi:hypothetical protein
VRPIIEGLRSSGISTLTGLADALNERGIQTPQGRRWHPMTVKRVVERLGGTSQKRSDPRKNAWRPRAAHNAHTAHFQPVSAEGSREPPYPRGDIQDFTSMSWSEYQALQS